MSRRTPRIALQFAAVAPILLGRVAGGQGPPPVVYVDASGGPAGNTVRASDGDPFSWYAIPGSSQDGLWGLVASGHEGTLFEAGGPGGTEDAPPIKTTLTGLTPGQTYRLWVHYRSAMDANGCVRAGLSPVALTLFDRLGAGGATAGGAGVLNLDMGAAGVLRDPLGGPAFAANGGTGAVFSGHDLWNPVLTADVAGGLLFADGSPAAGLRVNVGREDDAAPGTVNWSAADLLKNAGGQPEGLQRNASGGWASEVLHTYVRENAAASSPRAVAFAIEDVPPGRYDLYVVADNSFHTAAAGDQRQYHVYAGLADTAAGNTAFTALPRQTLTNAQWNTWQAGVNYARFSLHVAQPGQDVVMVSREVSGLDNNALITCAQLVPTGDALGRVELRGLLGETTADADGRIVVHVDDKPAAGGDDRSWYDGLSCQRVPAELKPPFVLINDNAGWCWFQDERTIVHDGKLIVGSVANAAGSEGSARSGNVEVATYDMASGSPPVISVLNAGLQADDHNDPALHVRPDGRFLAVYSKHGSDRIIRTRVSQHPGDSTSWQSELTYTAGAGATYANVFRLSVENGGLGLTYDFYRGEGFNPNVLTSTNDGTAWTYAGRLVSISGQRPYVKYASNRRDTIHFVYTEGHPSEYAPGTGIYHAFLRGGVIHRSDGTPIRALSAGPITPQEGTRIFAGAQGNRAWTIDLHLDADERPYLVYSVHKSNDDHRYRYARWDGSQWRDFEIAYAGQCLYASQTDYTGLAALDPHDPDRMWISTNADPATGAPLISETDGRRHWELFRGRTADGGAAWTWTPVTANSRVDNLRPIMPISDGDATALLWLRGTYGTYTSYDLDAVALILPWADFDADGQVDGADLAVFIACATGPAMPYDPGNPPAGCTVAPDAAGRISPDRDRDGDVDHVDFGAFQARMTGR